MWDRLFAIYPFISVFACWGSRMGFRFRRTLQIVPGIRLNLSQSGTSVSLGGRGLHYTIGPKGTRTTVGLPGTGLSWTEYKSYRSRSSAGQPAIEYLKPRAIPDGATTFDNADIDHLLATSTSEL